MIDLSKPVPWWVIVGSIVLLLSIVAVGILTVRYYKKKVQKENR